MEEDTASSHQVKQVPEMDYLRVCQKMANQDIFGDASMHDDAPCAKSLIDRLVGDFLQLSQRTNSTSTPSSAHSKSCSALEEPAFEDTGIEDYSGLSQSTPSSQCSSINQDISGHRDRARPVYSNLPVPKLCLDDEDFDSAFGDGTSQSVSNSQPSIPLEEISATQKPLFIKSVISDCGCCNKQDNSISGSLPICKPSCILDSSMHEDGIINYRNQDSLCCSMDHPSDTEDNLFSLMLTSSGKDILESQKCEAGAEESSFVFLEQSYIKTLSITDTKPLSLVKVPDMVTSVQIDQCSDCQMDSQNNNVQDVFKPDSPTSCMECSSLQSLPQLEYHHKRDSQTAKRDLNLFLQQFTPPVPDRLIGRRIGLPEPVDILGELNIWVPVTNILGFLSSQDLCSMCCVSRTWWNIIRQDRRANTRRLSYLDTCRNNLPQKENCGGKKRSSERGLTSGKSTEPFAALQFLAEPVEDSKVQKLTIPEQFWQEASKLRNDESLQKCPKCRAPSRTDRVMERSLCQNKARCGFEFCTRCKCAFHGAKDCSLVVCKKTKTDSTVGSKKSKKNLRRL